jgi:ABC-type transport system involved in multi-copper enzyme maturation permease subunit
MHRVIAAEFHKLKHSKIAWAIWFGALLPTLLYSAARLFSADGPPTWDSWFGSQYSVLLIFSPTLFSIIAGYIFGREYMHKTINSLFTYPYSRIHFLIGKWTVAVVYIVCTCLLAFLANVLSGLVFVEGELERTQISAFLFSYLIMAAAIVAVVPLWTLVAIIGKSFVPPVVISLVIVCLPGPIGGGSAYSDIVRYVLGIAGYGEAVNAGWFTAAAVGTFFLFMLLSAVLYVKSDVHSGT